MNSYLKNFKFYHAFRLFDLIAFDLYLFFALMLSICTDVLHCAMDGGIFKIIFKMLFLHLLADIHVVNFF